MNISLIIPMYNASDTIWNTLESVRRQTFHANYEIIVINDGSNDNSLEVVQKYREQHPHLNIILLNQNNGGVSKARNIGLKQASGQFIALLDSDDEWLPKKIERQMEILLSHPEIDFLGTTRNNEKLSYIFLKKIDHLTRLSPKTLLLRFVFVTPTIIFKKEIIQKVGLFNENQRYAEDGNYYIRIAAECNAYLLNESWVITGGGKHHYGEKGLSGDIFKMEKGELSNIAYFYRNRTINIFEFIGIALFSILKFIRRFFITKLRQLAKK